MQLLVYILLYPILYLISILPFKLLYLFSDGVYFLVYRIIGYRKKVVRENITSCFPDKPIEEIKRIEKKFYAYMCDMFLEMIKTMTISKKEIEKRYVFENMDTYYELEKKGKSIALLCAHYASYEWAVSMNYYTNFASYGVYKKLTNPYFDKLVNDIRSKFNAILINSKDTIPTMANNYRKNNLSLYGLVSDQSPKALSAHYWTEFMGQYVPVHTGGEMLAKKYDMNVIFLQTKRVKRGYYSATFEILSTDSKNVPNYEITDMFLKKVEKQIYDAPEFYLWTHKRWKHKKQRPE